MEKSVSCKPLRRLQRVATCTDTENVFSWLLYKWVGLCARDPSSQIMQCFVVPTVCGIPAVWRLSWLHAGLGAALLHVCVLRPCWGGWVGWDGSSWGAVRLCFHKGIEAALPLLSGVGCSGANEIEEDILNYKEIPFLTSITMLLIIGECSGCQKFGWVWNTT